MARVVLRAKQAQQEEQVAAVRVERAAQEVSAARQAMQVARTPTQRTSARARLATAMDHVEQAEIAHEVAVERRESATSDLKRLIKARDDASQRTTLAGQSTSAATGAEPAGRGPVSWVGDFATNNTTALIGGVLLLLLAGTVVKFVADGQHEDADV